MSREHKTKKLEEINLILARCKNNPNIQEMLMKEKRRLEKRISNIDKSDSDDNKQRYMKDRQPDDSMHNSKLEQVRQQYTSDNCRKQPHINRKQDNVSSIQHKKQVAKSKSVDINPRPDTRKEKHRNEPKPKQSIHGKQTKGGVSFDSDVSRNTEDKAKDGSERWNKSRRKHSRKKQNVEDKQSERIASSDTQSQQGKGRLLLDGGHRSDRGSYDYKDNGKQHSSRKSTSSLVRSNVISQESEDYENAQTAKSVNHALQNGSKLIKTFTSEEIHQMSTHTSRKKLPIYMQPPQYSETTKGNSSSAESKALIWKPLKKSSSNAIKDKDMDSSTQDGGKLKEANPLNASSNSSTLTPKLMKLREGKKLERKDAIDGAVKSSRNETTEYERSRGQSTEGNKTHHKLLRWQYSAPPGSTPATIQKRTKYPDASRDNSSVGNCDGIHLTDGTTLLKGEVVFRMDLDELKEKEPEKKGLSTFFRRKVLRSKSTLQTHMSTQTQTTVCSAKTQAYPWLMHNYLHTRGIQTSSISHTIPVATQTHLTHEDAHTQTSINTTNVSLQAEAPTKEIGTQTMPTTTDMKTQTEDEDHNVWEGGVSLDQLVRCRDRRRTRSVHGRDAQENKAKFEKFKRSATLPHGTKGKQNNSINPITAFSWTQTEKFVKVVVSHSGVHLIPASSIQVKSNGLSLKLSISKDEPQNGNTNSNNNLATSVTDELHIAHLCHPVAGLSYTVQADMITVLLRKKNATTWGNLQHNDTRNGYYL